MNLRETHNLLRYMSQEDARFRRYSGEMGEDVKRKYAETWLRALSGVDAEFATSFTVAYYKSVDKRRATVSHADIHKAWVEQRRRADRPPQAGNEISGPGVVDALARVGAAPEGYRQWVAAMAAASDEVRGEGVAAMDAAAAAVPKPATLAHPRAMTTAQQENDRWWRRCRNEAVCSCAHDECRDGWLDEELPEPLPGRPDRTVVQKCPRCADAVEMVNEPGFRKRRPA